MNFDCLIVGGGAAGLAAGVSLARAGLNAAILEAQPRVGRKLLATGNGRCNLTHCPAQPEAYFGDLALCRPALSAFPPERVVEFFQEIGVPTRLDSEGRAYPMSNQAASVLDALRLAFGEAGGQEITGFEVVSLRPQGGVFQARSGDGRLAIAPFALVAVGGLAGKGLGARDCPFLPSLGHPFTRRHPALSPLETRPIPSLKGVRAFARLTLGSLQESGEILFTEYGLSGIAAMQLSRHARPGAVLLIDFLPDEDGAQALLLRAGRLPQRRMEDFLNGLVPKRVGQALVKASGLSFSRMAGELSPEEIQSLGALLNRFPLPVLGVRGYDCAQATAGGTTGFDPETLESTRVPGLFAAGEVLDVDGPCGGYNLQWAWASALFAARSILQKSSHQKTAFF